MEHLVDGWKQAQKLIPELERIAELFGALEDYRKTHIISLSPKSREALSSVTNSLHQMIASIKKDARIVDSDLRRVG